MNITLEQTKELVKGKVRRNYGDTFIRGNNGMLQSYDNMTSENFADSDSDVHLCGLVKFWSWEKEESSGPHDNVVLHCRARAAF